MPKKWLTQIILAVFKNIFLCMTPFTQFRSTSPKFPSDYCLSWHVWLSTGINPSGNMSKKTEHIWRAQRALTETPKDDFQPKPAQLPLADKSPPRVSHIRMAQSPPPLKGCRSNCCNKKLNRSQRIIGLQKHTTHCSKEGRKIWDSPKQVFVTHK